LISVSGESRIEFRWNGRKKRSRIIPYEKGSGSKRKRDVKKYKKNGQRGGPGCTLPNQVAKGFIWALLTQAREKKLSESPERRKRWKAAMKSAA